jgi:hypothetical protein
MIDRVQTNQQSLQDRARIRAVIRRNDKTRKSVQEGKPDRLADLLEDMADYIDFLEAAVADKM